MSTLTATVPDRSPPEVGGTMTQRARETDPSGARVELLSRPEDDELVRRIQAGDRWAEEVLYRRYALSLGNMAARILGDRDGALDVVQDTFAIAFDELDRLRDPRRVRPWLRQIAIRQVHRRLRRRDLRRRLGLLSSVPEGAEAVSPGLDAERNADLRLAVDALKQVGAQARVCWALRMIEGYTVAEVADACRLSESTAKRRIRDAQLRIDAHVAGHRPRRRRER